MFSSVLLWLLSTFLNLSWAQVLLAPEEALRQTYGAQINIERTNILLTDPEIVEITKSVRQPINEHVFVFFKLSQNGVNLGYAGLQSQKVRSKDMAALYMLSTSGELKNIEIVAFYEPPEYKPKQKWLEQFREKNQLEKMRYGHEITAVSGATLSAQAVTKSARLILAIWQHRFREK